MSYSSGFEKSVKQLITESFSVDREKKKISLYFRSMVLVVHCEISHEFAHNTAERLIKAHCLPLEISINDYHFDEYFHEDIK